MAISERDLTRVPEWAREHNRTGIVVWRRGRLAVGVAFYAAAVLAGIDASLQVLCGLLAVAGVVTVALARKVIRPEVSDASS